MFQQRTYLVDRQSSFLELFDRALKAEPGFEIIGTNTDSDRAYLEIVDRSPDLVITDVELPGRGAMTLAADVRRRMPGTKVVFLSSYLSDVCIDEALRIHAHGFLLKTDSMTDLIRLLTRIAGGEVCFSEDVQQRIAVDGKSYRVVTSSELSNLTERQMEVLRQLSRGKSVKEVSRKMSLSERAVESHKYRIMQKLGIHDRVDLAMFAVREGLLIP